MTMDHVAAAARQVHGSVSRAVRKLNANTPLEAQAEVRGLAQHQPVWISPGDKVARLNKAIERADFSSQPETALVKVERPDVGGHGGRDHAMNDAHEPRQPG